MKGMNKICAKYIKYFFKVKELIIPLTEPKVLSAINKSKFLFFAK